MQRAALHMREPTIALSGRQRSKITPPKRPAMSMATYCTPVTRPAMLPATSTASQTLATRNRSSPIEEVQRPDQTVSTARSLRGRKTGNVMAASLHPDAAVLVAVAERQIRRVDQRLAALVHEQAGTHLVHRVAERQAGRGIGEAQRAAGADMAEGGAAQDHAVAILAVDRGTDRAAAVVHRLHESQRKARGQPQRGVVVRGHRDLAHAGQRLCIDQLAAT